MYEIVVKIEAAPGKSAGKAGCKGCLLKALSQ